MRVRIGLWMIAAATVAAAVVIVLMTEAPRPALSIEFQAADEAAHKLAAMSYGPR